MEIKAALFSMRRRRAASTEREVSPLPSSTIYSTGRPRIPPALLISSTAYFWISMQGLVPGEATLPTYPITIGLPAGAAKAVGKNPNPSNVKTATITIPNLIHLSIGDPPFTRFFGASLPGPPRKPLSMQWRTPYPIGAWIDPIFLTSLGYISSEYTRCPCRYHKRPTSPGAGIPTSSRNSC